MIWLNAREIYDHGTSKCMLALDAIESIEPYTFGTNKGSKLVGKSGRMYLSDETPEAIMQKGQVRA